MIRSFKCRETQRKFYREHSRRFAGLEHAALKKLLMLEAAESIEDLRVPPGNRLEKLAGNRAGAASISRLRPEKADALFPM